MKYANKMMTLARLGAAVCASQTVMAQDKGNAYPTSATEMRIEERGRTVTHQRLYHGLWQRCTNPAGCRYDIHAPNFSAPFGKDWWVSDGSFWGYMDAKFRAHQYAFARTIPVSVANGKSAQWVGFAPYTYAWGYFQGVMERFSGFNGRLTSYRWANKRYGRWSGTVSYGRPYHTVVYR